MNSRDLKLTWCRFGAVVALMTAGLARADGGTWYMTNAETTSNFGALWTASKWNSAEDGTGEPPEAFSASDTYISLSTIVARGSGRTFPGGLLISKGAFWTAAAGSISFPRGLRLDSGGWRNRYGAFDIYGPVEITALGTYPYLFFCDDGSVSTFHGSFSGASNIRITCGENSAAGEGSAFVFAGDNSAYYGLANIKPSSKGKCTKAGFASFPGTVSVFSNAVLLVGVAGADTVSTYKELSLANGASLELLAEADDGVLRYPSLAATNTLGVGESVTIVIPQAALPSDGMPHAVDVLTGPVGTVLNAQNFTLRTADGESLPADYLKVVDNGRKLQIAFPAVISSGVTFLTGDTPASGTNELHDITFEAESVIKLNGAWSGVGEDMTYSSAVISVSTSLELTPPVKISATRFAVPADGAAHVIDVLIAPPGVTLDAADFVFERTEDGVQIATLLVRQDGGRDVLAVAFEPVVEMVASDPISSARASDPTSRTAWLSASSWSDNRIPHAGAHYLVRKISDADQYWFFRTPTDNAHYKFPGDSLTIEKDVWMMVFQGGGFTLTVDDLRLRDGASFLYGQSTFGTVAGRITLEGGTVNIGSYGNGIIVNSDLYGSGEFLVSGPKDYGSLAYGTVTLAGDNSNFTGKFNVEYCRSNPDAGLKFSTLLASASDQFGADLDVFEPAAIRLAKYGKLVIKDDVTISADSNRGLTVDGLGGNIAVMPGKTFTLGTRLTLDGPLTKSDEGTLVLAGDADADGEVFTVAEGSLVISGANALNGVQTTLAEGASVMIAADPEDEDLCRYGIRNVKATTPWTFSGSTLPLSIRMSAAALDKKPVFLGIFTAADATAAAETEAVLPDLSNALKGYHGVKTTVTDSVTGNVTIAYNYFPVGLVITLR